MDKRTIIGIDPGTNLLGFGVIDVVDKKPVFVDMGVLDLRKEKDAYSKLRQIYDTVSEVCKTYHGTEMALESPFYGKNPQTMLKLGRAQGAAIAAGLLKDIPIYEYAPTSVKLAVTGKGSASKEQVSAMVQSILGITCDVKYLDATDAVAIALCHFYTQGSITAKSAAVDVMLSLSEASSRILTRSRRSLQKTPPSSTPMPKPWMALA